MERNRKFYSFLLIVFILVFFVKRLFFETSNKYIAPGMNTEPTPRTRQEELDFLLKATKFATERHELQKRKAHGGQTPYIIHPVTVAEILSSAGVSDVEVLAGALLHDTIEDTNTTKEELEAAFGPRVTRIVLDCSDDKSLPWQVRKIKQIEHAPHMLPDSQLVKIADKIANVEDILDNGSPWGAVRTQGYIAWAAEVVKGIPRAIPSLHERFERAFTRSFRDPNGDVFPAVPADKTREQILKEFLARV